jgi:hypothetical protein
LPVSGLTTAWTFASRAALGAVDLAGGLVLAGVFTATVGVSVSGTWIAPVGCAGSATAAGAPAASSLSRRSSSIEIAFSLTSLRAVSRLSWASIESSRLRNWVICVSLGGAICVCTGCGLEVSTSGTKYFPSGPGKTLRWSALTWSSSLRTRAASS